MDFREVNREMVAISNIVINGTIQTFDTLGIVTIYFRIVLYSGTCTNSIPLSNNLVGAAIAASTKFGLLDNQKHH